MRLGWPLVTKTFDLAPLSAAIRVPFPMAANHLELERLTDEASRDLLLRLKTYLLAKIREEARGCRRVFFPVPTSWWQHLKRDHFPHWLIRLFPVQYTQASKLVTTSHSTVYLCPHADVKFDTRNSRNAHFTFLERRTGDFYLEKGVDCGTQERS